MAGAMAITYMEIEAWGRLTQQSPSPSDIKIIKQLDNVAVKTRK